MLKKNSPGSTKQKAGENFKKRVWRGKKNGGSMVSAEAKNMSDGEREKKGDPKYLGKGEARGVERNFANFVA